MTAIAEFNGHIVQYFLNLAVEIALCKLNLTFDKQFICIHSRWVDIILFNGPECRTETQLNGGESWKPIS